MKQILFITILMLVSCQNQDKDEFLGSWYINRDIENNQIVISKSNNNYIVEVNDKKLIATKEKNVLLIENKGEQIKAIILETGDMIFNGESATRVNPKKENNDDIFGSPNDNADNDINSLPFGDASISAKNVIFRKSHSTTSSIIGKFRRSGERVQILDEYSPSNSDEAITSTSIRLYNSNGYSAYTLPKGKAVRILSDNNGTYQVSFEHPKHGNLHANIVNSDLEFISGDKWYKVKRKDGKIGWVFSKFINK